MAGGWRCELAVEFRDGARIRDERPANGLKISEAERGNPRRDGAAHAEEDGGNT